MTAAPDPRETLRRRQVAARKAWAARKRVRAARAAGELDLRQLDLRQLDLRPADAIPTGRAGAAGAAPTPAAPPDPPRETPVPE